MICTYMYISVSIYIYLQKVVGFINQLSVGSLVALENRAMRNVSPSKAGNSDCGTYCSEEKYNGKCSNV